MSRYNGDVTDDDPSSKQESASNPQEQLKIIQRAHELNPNDPKPLRQMAKLYKTLRKLDAAARTHLMLAEVYRKQGDTKRMLAEWEVAVRVRPALIDVREELALAYEEQENTKRAVQTWLSLAEYYEKRGEWDNALAATQEAIRLNPQHPKALEYLHRYQKKLTM
ncbi:MAG: tetratricopeptide repeat protein [Anaerolineae bacterium]